MTEDNKMSNLDDSKKSLIEELKMGATEIFDHVSFLQHLNCIKDKTLDFGLIESDLEKFEEKYKEKEDEAFVTKVSLDFQEKKIKFEIYTKNQTVFKRSIFSEFQKYKNVPENILERLKVKQQIDLMFSEDVKDD